MKFNLLDIGSIFGFKGSVANQAVGIDARGNSNYAFTILVLGGVSVAGLFLYFKSGEHYKGIVPESDRGSPIPANAFSLSGIAVGGKTNLGSQITDNSITNYYNGLLPSRK
jgi:hypothetical protein